MKKTKIILRSAVSTKNNPTNAARGLCYCYYYYYPTIPKALESNPYNGMAGMPPNQPTSC